MKYQRIVEGIFRERINRFVAIVDVFGSLEKVHVKNTGRCKELLIPGSTVYLEDFTHDMRSRKLKYSLIAVEKLPDKILINMDSNAPNKVIEEKLISGDLHLPNMGEITLVKRESTFKNSRFDFYVEDNDQKKAFVEVKGVTLEDMGITRFPDAPTLRGIKHINELIEAKKEGYNAYIIFVIQLDGALLFTPNYDTHPEFGLTLKKAMKAGVSILAYDCYVTPDSLMLSKAVTVELE